MYLSAKAELLSNIFHFVAESLICPYIAPFDSANLASEHFELNIKPNDMINQICAMGACLSSFKYLQLICMGFLMYFLNYQVSLARSA